MGNEFEKSFEGKESLMKEAYDLLGATGPLNLSHLYTAEDQKLMKSGEWDYKNQELVVNKVKDVLEGLDPAFLSEEEKEWRGEILWFWYHHAISCAIWHYHDKPAAIEFSNKALSYQSPEHPNKITKLLSLFVEGKMSEAEEWAKGIQNEVEKETAAYVIEDYKKHGFDIL